MRRIPTTFLGTALVALAIGCGPKGDTLGPMTRTGRLAPLLEGMGDLHREVSTRDPMAQRFFDQGLTLLYGFNHDEALRSFREAARIDPDCVMAYWGQAMALAPNINDPAPQEERERDAFAAIQEALARKDRATEKERAMVEALAPRYSENGKEDRAKLNRAYADSMRALYERYPDDPDIAALFADAVMNTMPWAYWNKDGSPKPGMKEALQALESVIRDYPRHPGAHHIYIHAVEASREPERAEPSADRLGSLVPGAGHLVHMPSHIYIRVGRYADATRANELAIEADEDYITQCRAQGIYPAAYYPHNIHFLTVTLAMEGRGEAALEAARKVASRPDGSSFCQPGFGFPYLLRAQPLFAMVRFGMWEAILKEPEPPADQKFPAAIWHYARGMALVSQGKLEAASRQLQQVQRLADLDELKELKIFDANSLADLAHIAEEVLAGEIDTQWKRYDQAVAHFRKAIEIEESLTYSEPPDWPIPVRHNLGAALLEAGRPAEAERVYREDLERHRNNGWALAGLAKSLEAQGREQEAAEVRNRLNTVWARADIEPRGSRL